MASVTRRAGKKEKPAKASVEDQMLAAVEQLLGDGHSFTALSIEKLATAAGVSRATFYLHFRDKSDLVVRLMGRVRQEVLDSIGVWYASAGNVSRDQVANANLNLLRVLKRHHAILTAVGETSAYDPEVKHLLDKLLEEISAKSVATIKSVKQAGKAHPDVSAMVVQIMTWMVYYGGMHFIKGAGEAKLRKVAEAMSHITRSAIFVDEPVSVQTPLEKRKVSSGST